MRLSRLAACSENRVCDAVLPGDGMSAFRRSSTESRASNATSEACPRVCIGNGPVDHDHANDRCTHMAAVALSQSGPAVGGVATVLTSALGEVGQSVVRFTTGDGAIAFEGPSTGRRERALGRD